MCTKKLHMLLLINWLWHNEIINWSISFKKTQRKHEQKNSAQNCKISRNFPKPSATLHLINPSTIKHELFNLNFLSQNKSHPPFFSSMVTVFCGWIRVVKRRGRGSSFVGSNFSWDLIHNERPGSIGYRSGFSKLDNY